MCCRNFRAPFLLPKASVFWLEKEFLFKNFVEEGPLEWLEANGEAYIIPVNCSFFSFAVYVNIFAKKDFAPNQVAVHLESSVFHNIKHKMEVRNAPVFRWPELLPSDAILWAVEKSSHIIRYEAMMKTVSWSSISGHLSRWSSSGFPSEQLKVGCLLLGIQSSAPEKTPAGTELWVRVSFPTLKQEGEGGEVLKVLCFPLSCR